jgi:hypothetical protein
LGGKEASIQQVYGDPTLNSSDSRHYNATIQGTDVLIAVGLQAGVMASEQGSFIW